MKRLEPNKVRNPLAIVLIEFNLSHYPESIYLLAIREGRSKAFKLLIIWMFKNSNYNRDNFLALQLCSSAFKTDECTKR